METRRIIVGDPNGPLHAILEVEEDRRVIAVLRPNGSIMEYRDIPEWIFMDIRHRGMIYVGDVLLNTQMPEQNPPILRSQETTHNRMETRRITIGEPNSPLRAILEVEEDRRVVAVLRLNGSPMEYRDIPEWVLRDIRERGMVYTGNVFNEPELPQQQSSLPPPPLSQQKSGPSGMCRGCGIIAVAIGGLFLFGVILAAIFGNGDSTVPVAQPRPSPTWTAEEREKFHEERRQATIAATEAKRSREAALATAQPTPTPRPTPTPVSYVPVQDIVSTFRANPARGKVQFMQAPIHVTGKIVSFNNSDSRVVYLTPEATWETEDYEVFLIRFSTLSQAAALSIGDNIRVRCDMGEGYAFPHGYELECSPIGSVLPPPTPTPRPTPTPTATAIPVPPVTATAQAAPTATADAIRAMATAEAAPTATAIAAATATARPTPTPTFEERKQVVIDRHCSGVQACIDLMQTEYCVEFYENPPQYYTRYGACTAWALGG